MSGAWLLSIGALCGRASELRAFTKFVSNKYTFHLPSRSGCVLVFVVCHCWAGGLGAGLGACSRVGLLIMSRLFIVRGDFRSLWYKRDRE